MYVTIVKKRKYIIEQSDMCRSDQRSDGANKSSTKRIQIAKQAAKKQVGKECNGTRACLVVEEELLGDEKHQSGEASLSASLRRITQTWARLELRRRGR